MKPKWIFVHFASGKNLTPPEGISFWKISPKSDCPRKFSQVHRSEGSAKAVQLSCFRDLIGTKPSVNGHVPLTFLDIPPSTISDVSSPDNTLIFWKTLIDTLSTRWNVVVTVLYEPFFTFAVREWPVHLAENAPKETVSLDRELQWLARRHTNAHLTTLFDHVEIKTSWQEIHCLIKCPVLTNEVNSTYTPQDCGSCVPITVQSQIWKLSWEQEKILLGPQGHVNATRLAQEYDACLQLSGCAGQGHDSVKGWKDRASLSS
jgi:hypothetical protein